MITTLLSISSSPVWITAEAWRRPCSRGSRDSTSTTRVGGQHRLGNVLLMEKMPYQERSGEDTIVSTTALALPSPEATSDWRNGLPALAGTQVTLRELRVSDAPSLFLALATDEVTR